MLKQVKTWVITLKTFHFFIQKSQSQQDSRLKTQDSKLTRIKHQYQQPTEKISTWYKIEKRVDNRLFLSRLWAWLLVSTFPVYTSSLFLILDGKIETGPMFNVQSSLSFVSRDLCLLSVHFPFPHVSFSVLRSPFSVSVSVMWQGFSLSPFFDGYALTPSLSLSPFTIHHFLYSMKLEEKENGRNGNKCEL